jgi:hypothetical protein
VTGLENLKRNQGREGSGGREERRMGRGEGGKEGRKKERKKERRKEGTTEGRAKRRKKRRNDKNARVSQVLRCAATTPLPRCARSPSLAGLPCRSTASPHSATPRVSFPLSLPTNSFPRPNPTSKTFHSPSPVQLFLSPIPALRSFAPTLLHHRDGHTRFFSPQLATKTPCVSN